MIKVLDNVYDLVTLNMEQRFAERVAFRFYNTEKDEVTTVHFKEYAQDIRRAVNYFQSTIPDIKGKKICLLNKNCYEYAVNTFGVLLAGGVLVLLNQHKSWDELSYELGLVEPAAILTDGEDYGTKAQLQDAYGSILRPMDAFRAYEPVQELTRCIDHDALMILMFTSGTTGRSKGVMLSERNFFSVMRAHVQIGEQMMDYKNDQNLLVSQYTVLPMFHLGAFICLFSWAHGGWALNVSSDIRNFYKEVQRMPSQVMAVVISSITCGGARYHELPAQGCDARPQGPPGRAVGAHLLLCHVRPAGDAGYGQQRHVRGADLRRHRDLRRWHHQLCSGCKAYRRCGQGQ